MLRGEARRHRLGRDGSRRSSRSTRSCTRGRSPRWSARRSGSAARPPARWSTWRRSGSCARSPRAPSQAADGDDRRRPASATGSPGPGRSAPACRCSACSWSGPSGITKSDVDAEYVGAAVLFLGAGRLGAGTLATLFAAKAIADPVTSVRAGLERIERGRPRRPGAGRRRQRGRACCRPASTGWPTACASASGSATCSGARSARTWRGRRFARALGWAARSARSARCSSTSSARPRWPWPCRRPRWCACSTASSGSWSRSSRPRAAW